MSGGKKLHEMEIGTKQSKTAVNRGAKPGDPMPKLTTGVPDGQTVGNWDDLGGPTPFNYKPDDESAKLKDPAGPLKKVNNVVNKGAKPAEPTPHMKSPVKEDEDFDYNQADILDEDLEDEDLEDESLYEESDEDSEDDDEDDEDDKKKSKKEDDDEDEDDEEDVKEEVIVDLYDFNIDEDVSAILNSDETSTLSEEFKEKTRTIFEAALRGKAEELNEFYSEHYENQLVEEVQLIKEELIDRTDSYLEYVAEQWMAENEMAVQQSLEHKLVESFLVGFKNLCEEHYVHIPEEKYDVLHMMKQKLDEMEEKLDDQVRSNIEQKQRIEELTADGIFEEITGDLADSQRDKLSRLAENVEFESEEQYREKLETLKEAYTSNKSYSKQTHTAQTLTENNDIGGYQEIDPLTESILKFL
jgi:hypothetical protein